MTKGKVEGRRSHRRLPIPGVVLLAGSVLAAMALPGVAIAEEAGAVTPPAASQPVVSLRLLPDDPRIWGAEASQQFLLLARFADGLERDVTGQGRYNLSDPQVAEVDGDGKVVARSNGRVVLTAAFQDRTASTGVVIDGISEERPFSFARDIGAIFTKTGCNNSECHGGVKGQGGLKLSVNALFPKEDYRWITEGGIYQVMSAEAAGEKTPRVNLKEPEQSLLLLKPTLAVPHGGGQRLNPESSSYRTLLRWIRDGAPYGEEGSEEIARIERLEVLPREVVLEVTSRTSSVYSPSWSKVSITLDSMSLTTHCPSLNVEFTLCRLVTMDRPAASLISKRGVKWGGLKPGVWISKARRWADDSLNR